MPEPTTSTFYQDMQNKIVHLMVAEKFIQPFIYFIKENIGIEHHLFLICGDTIKYPLKSKTNVIVEKTIGNLIIKKIANIYEADKIFLHGLFDTKLILFFYLQPWLLKKTYWIIWGSDLYAYKIPQNTWKLRLQEHLRKSVIKKLGNIVTCLEGDYILAKKVYRTNAKYHNCFMYTSNLFENKKIKEKIPSSTNIQIGNSADPSNEHLEILNLLTKFKNENIIIYAPLSYGNKIYAEKVITEGKKLFGEKFKPLTEMLSEENYLEFLSKIDIAIFNHRRQQAMGNTISLLGLGKKVHIREEVTPWKLFKELGVFIKGTKEIDLNPLPKDIANKNSEIIIKYFSKENLNNQLANLFDN